MRGVQIWLYCLCLMVFAMVLLGGATRLTDSGLSITEWRPLIGMIPPLSDLDWQSVFQKYQQIPEYAQVNEGMSLDQFKRIFWWEWSHRLVGRLVGLVAIAGFVFFWIKQWLTRPLALRLVLLIALGGLQGFIGWWMVSSGLGETSRIDVAPYRLAVHFSLALLIIAITAWTWMDIGERTREPAPGRARSVAIALLVLISLQMVAGALVAGLDAGRTYTDWPLMAGEFVPSAYWSPELYWRSLIEGREATQFNHRMLAYCLWFASLAALAVYRRTALATVFALVSTLVTLQAGWGILTLINAAPLGLALVHQGLGVLVLLAGVRLVWRASPPPAM